MQRSYIRTTLLIAVVSLLPSLISTGAFARVKARRRAEVVKAAQPAPSFTVRTLEGVTYSNASLGGSPALLQFWTTQCRDCREDQVALDEIDNKFSGQGLVVLAINEGEPAATVQKYLREHPRTVRIVLDERRQIARRFGKVGYPYYVLIDRQGRVAGTQRGATGQQGLLSLLRRTGLQERQPAQARSMSSKATVLEAEQDTKTKGKKETNKTGKSDNEPGAIPDANQSANTGDSRAAAERKVADESKQAEAGKPPAEKAAQEPPKPSGMKVIDIPPDKDSHPGQPLPKAVFVLTNGERLESDRYTMDPQFLHIAVEGEERAIAMGSVDVKATESANHARGIDLKIPTSKSEVFVSF